MNCPWQFGGLAQQVSAEGFYNITVALARNDVTAYGRPQPRTAGMQLEADVLQDTRSLIEWLFERSVSLRAKL